MSTVTTELPDIAPATTPTVLFVDLDDTLIKTDLLAESLVKIAKKSPVDVLRAGLKLRHGRAAFKAALAGKVIPDVTLLPYREDVLEFLRQKVVEGVSLVLATASPRPWAEAIAAHLGIFDDVIASDRDHNLKGSRKLAAIREYVEREHHSAWAYIGDSASDLPIFAEADQAHVVTASRSLTNRVRRVAPDRMTVLEQSAPSWRDFARALRPHQWAKNVLVFVPMVLAHTFAAPQMLATFLAWICFSCVASGVYVLNDMLDVESDRRHPRKCRRPFASGKLPLTVGPLLVVALLGAGMTLAAASLPLKFFLLLGAYWGLTTLYTVWLKNKLIIDVMVLAGLYTLRVIAGGAAVNVPVSEWLMAFSMFLFTSLAFAKRYAELSRLAREANAESASAEEKSADSQGNDHNRRTSTNRQPHGRGYQVEDISLIESVGPTSGYLSVLVLAMYISSPQVTALYPSCWVLWYICPVLLYWITRIWMVAKRGRLSEDPVIFALRDEISQLSGVVVAVLMYIAVVS